MRKQTLLIFGAAFFATLFVIFGAVYLWQRTDGKQSGKAFAEAAAMVRTEVGESTGEDTANDESAESKPLTAYEKYAPVYEANNDFVGWLSIPGTHIDYPVVQTPAVPDYYLRRGFDGQPSLHGTPYVQESCVIDLSDNTVVYGHHMNDGTMFADLCWYADEDFYREHSIIRFDTLGGYGEYEVVAVFKTVAYTEEGFAYYRFVGAASAEDFDAYIVQCKQLSLYDTGVSAAYGDKLLTLSTCEYSQPDGRMVVVARKMEPSALEADSNA